MSFKIAIASGKGGTGKTTVAVNLFYFLQKQNLNIQLLDCDVEEPNSRLFFSNLKQTKNKVVNQLIPQIDASKCVYCKKCQDYCEFNAISIITNVKFAEINPDLCHSCGACSYACNYNAIGEIDHKIGKIGHFQLGPNAELIEGRLKIGSTMQTMVIKAVKKNSNPNCDIVLFDAPPGTSCPVVETVADADYTILVTEPTPFGLYDLKLTIDLLQDIKKPFGVIMNKSGVGDNNTHEYLKEREIELLGEIAFNETYAGNYASGDIFNNIPEIIESVYSEIIKKIKVHTLTT